MMTAAVLLVLALIMIYLEFFLPGGVMGTAGALLVLASLVFFAQTSDSLAATLIFVIAAAAGVVFACKFALYRVRRTAGADSIFHDSDQEGYRAPKFNEALIGKRGKTTTSMSPSGHIEIDGVRHQAVSKFGYLEKGTKIEVISGQAGHLVVRRLDSNK